MTDRKEPIAAVIQADYNLRKAELQYLEYLDHTIQCIDQALGDLKGTEQETHSHEVASAVALLHEQKADAVRFTRRVRKSLVKTHRAKGFRDLKTSDYEPYGAINR